MNTRRQRDDAATIEPSYAVDESYRQELIENRKRIQVARLATYPDDEVKGNTHGT